jgi:uncharacterized membrane protein YidH (DUF202 family)
MMPAREPRRTGKDMGTNRNLEVGVALAVLAVASLSAAMSAHRGKAARRDVLAIGAFALMIGLASATVLVLGSD